MINWELKRIITERCGSQVNFSMRIGRPQSVVSEVVRGIRRLSDEEKACWAKVLDVDPGLIHQACAPVLVNVRPTGDESGK
jgi:hypothetical protein